MSGVRLGRRAWLAGVGAAVAGAERAAAQTHPLQGRSIDLALLGVADWRPSLLVREMAPGFVAYAKENHGYEVTVRYEEAPFPALYEKEAASLSEKTATYHLVIADSQWLGAFASEKWILPLNPIIEANRALEVEWYAPKVRDAYQLFPDGSNNRWGMPQSGDVLALFVRRDWLADPAEQADFKEKYGAELPQDWEAFRALDWGAYGKVLEFFTRPAREVYGLAAHTSAEYDYFSCPAVSFILSQGGEVWEPRSGQVEGVLNTDANAAALAQYVALLKYMPLTGRDAGVDQVARLFTEGRVFSALQWAGAGPSMIPAGMQDKVLVVPPPGFAAAEGKLSRDYVIGGQLWAVNDRNDEAHLRVAIDFLSWWFRPETALDFARRGGLPCDKATLAREDFDAIQPWFRTYKFMLPRSSDFWHDPRFAELLRIQQTGFTELASGRVTDARAVLDAIACRQQSVLFEEGSAERRPSPACAAVR